MVSGNCTGVGVWVKKKILVLFTVFRVLFCVAGNGITLFTYIVLLHL
jgi:hypothetical protein